MQTDWIVCKPPLIGVVVLFAMTLSFCAVVVIILPLVGAPAWVLAWGAMYALIGIGQFIAISRSHFRYNEDKIEVRYFRHIKRRWDDASGWSRIGENSNSLYIRFTDGAIIGSDGVSISRADVDALIPILEQKLGDPKTGDETIMPWYVKILIGRLVR